MMFLRTSILIGSLLMVGSTTFAQEEPKTLAVTSEAQLKTAFLDCDKASTEGVLEPEQAAACSMVYTELLERIFRKDFSAFMAWWKTTKTSQ